MENVEHGDYEVMHMELKNAIKLLEENSESVKATVRPNLVSLTYNNLACYYQRTAKPNAALHCLSRSLAEYKKYGANDQPEYAYCLLNICAILSKLSKHSCAAEYARQAVGILEKVENNSSTATTIGLSLIHI
eukprot:TRINITY_DN21551_c0_g1_i2.p2 TRINITY_DN21551_c0_g1~~TRINITY_DN21551_c0_g1_i2.p2  ORF type:complete len:133 (-),score=15.42 TRINITY_DN21551_c0_g1_i2:149-547(-)